MMAIESEVLETCLAQLAQVDDVPGTMTEKLGELLAAETLPKPEQLAALYAETSGESML